MANVTIYDLKQATAIGSTVDAFPVYNSSSSVAYKISGQNFIKNIFNNSTAGINDTDKILFIDGNKEKVASLSQIKGKISEEISPSLTKEDIFNFTLGTQITPGDDLNDFLNLGKYYFQYEDSELSNTPWVNIQGVITPETPCFTMTVEQFAPDIIRQTIYRMDYGYSIRDIDISGDEPDYHIWHSFPEIDINISDLTGTTWILNRRITFPATIKTYNNINGKVYLSSTGSPTSIVGIKINGTNNRIQVKRSNILSIVLYDNGQWYNSDFDRKIEITDGSDSTDQTLINFFKSNGLQQY